MKLNLFLDKKELSIPIEEFTSDKFFKEQITIVILEGVDRDKIVEEIKEFASDPTMVKTCCAPPKGTLFANLYEKQWPRMLVLTIKEIAFNITL